MSIVYSQLPRNSLLASNALMPKHHWTLNASIRFLVLGLLMGFASAPSALAIDVFTKGTFDSGSLSGTGIERSLEGDRSKMTLSFPTSPVRAGARSAKFTGRVTNQTFPILRNEIQIGRWSNPVIGATGIEYIYTFSHYVPSSWPTSALPIEVSQFPAPPDSGEPWRAPVLAFVMVNGKMEITTRWDTRRISTYPSNRPPEALVYSQTMARNVWVDWRVEVRWRWDNLGYLRIYRNGVIVVNRTGLPNCYNDSSPRYFKAGVYTRSGWARSSFPTADYIFYLDEFKVQIK
jgi:hypothetical protein